MNIQKRRGRSKGSHASVISFYWQHYGLLQDPFSAIHDPNMLYSFPALENRLDLLQHLINNENLLLAVLGAEGSGKTTLAHQFIQQADSHIRTHYFLADSFFSTRKLVRELENGFQLKVQGNESAEEQLDAQIAAVQHSDKTCVLLVDDAHFLPLETLVSVLALLKQQSPHQMRLHILLLGDKNLQEKLINISKQEENKNLIHIMELQPLNLKETNRYIENRLNKTGLKGPLPFTQMQIEQIYVESKGWPGEINMYAQQMLLDELAKRKAMQNPNFIRKHQTKMIGGLLIVFTLVVVSYVLNRSGGANENEDKPVIAFANPNGTMNTPEPLSTSEAINSQTTIPEKPVSVQRVQPQLTSSAQKQKKQLTLEPLPAIATVMDVGPEANILENKQSFHLAQLESIDNKPKLKIQHIDVIAQPQLKQQYQQQVLGINGSATKQTARSFITKTEIPIHSKAKATIVKSHREQVLSSVNKLAATEQKLLAINPAHYTLQLIGLSYASSIQHFIKIYGLKDKVTIIDSSLHGKPWYVLIYGNYVNREAAERALGTLPTSLRQYRPYARSFADVHEEIRLNKR